MYGNTSTLASGIKALNDFLRSRFVWRDHLPIVIGGNTAHHIMCSGHNGDGIPYRVRIGKLYRDFTYARESRLDYIRPQMIELQEQVIRISAASSPSLYFHCQRAGHHVATRQVLGVRGIAFHEALPVLVEQIAAFAAHRLADEYANPVHACGVELPELHVFQWNAGPRRHAEAITRIDERIGAGAEYACRSPGGEQCGPARIAMTSPVSISSAVTPQTSPPHRESGPAPSIL